MNKTILYEAVYWHEEHQSLLRTPLDATHMDAAINEAKQRQSVMGQLKQVEMLKTSIIYTTKNQGGLKV